MAKKYTYKDWWDGTICLNTCVIITQKDDPAPIIVGWDSIIEKDHEKIKNKQHELFHSGINSKADILEKDFLKRYENSRMKEKFLKDEIALNHQILYGTLKDFGDVYFTHHRSISFEKDDLHKIQEYAIRVLKNGQHASTYFIHSPHCHYQQKDRPPIEIRAQIHQKQYEFLNDFYTAEKRRVESVRKKNNEDEVPGGPEEPENSFPDIFKSGHAYNLYLMLVKMTVTGDSKKISADYGFIFNKMRYHKNSGESDLALKINVTELVFIDFLRYEMKIDFPVGKRLPIRNPKTKETIYNELHEEAIELIKEMRLD